MYTVNMISFFKSYQSPFLFIHFHCFTASVFLCVWYSLESCSPSTFGEWMELSNGVALSLCVYGESIEALFVYLFILALCKCCDWRC